MKLTRLFSAPRNPIFVRSEEKAYGKLKYKKGAAVEIDLNVDTGIALRNLGGNQTVELQLRDKDGNVVSKANIDLAANAHTAKLLRDFNWDRQVNLSKFLGTVTASGISDFTALVLRLRPGELASLPVTKIE